MKIFFIIARDIDMVSLTACKEQIYIYVFVKSLN